MNNAIKDTNDQVLTDMIGKAKVNVRPKDSTSKERQKYVRHVSNSLTSIQNSFYAVLAHTTNASRLRVALLGNQESLRKERALEAPPPKSPIATDSSLTPAVEEVTKQVNELGKALDKLDMNGGSSILPDIGLPSMGRILPSLPAVSTMAAAAGAAAVTGGLLYATSKGMDAAYDESNNSLLMLERKYGMKAIKNDQGFTTGWTVDGKRYTNSNLPEYYRMVVDAEGPGADPKWGSTRRAREYLQTHPRPGTEGTFHRVSAGTHNPVANASKDGTINIQGGKGSLTDSKRAAAARAGDRRVRQLTETATRAASGRAVPKQRTSSTEKSMSDTFAEKLGSFFDSIKESSSNMLTTAADTVGGWLGVGSGEYSGVGPGGIGAWAQDKPFLDEVDRVARSYNIDANDLLGLMQSESRINAQAVNSSTGATGLIQFMPKTARGLGTTTAELARMSRAQQMKFVDAYFRSVGLPKGANAGQLYGAVFLPGRVNDNPLTRIGESYYNSNRGLDVDRNGDISQQDLIARVSAKRQSIGLGPSKTAGGFTAVSGVIRNVASNIGDWAENTLTGHGKFIEPVAGARVTSGFGPRKPPKAGASAFHKGIDYGAVPRGQSGQAIHASAAGVVTFAGPQNRANLGIGYGNYVKIDHGGGYETLYGHLSAYRATVGQRVQQGQQIGNMGSTGTSSGPHLHFELRKGGQAINPTNVLGAASVSPDNSATEPGNEPKATRQPSQPKQVATTAGDVAARKRAARAAPVVSPVAVGRGGRRKPVTAPGTPAPSKPKTADPRPWYQAYFGL